LYDTYLHKMEQALAGAEWLVGDRFSIADISLTPYVNRLAMLSMQDMWRAGRLPNVERWFAAVQTRPTFKPALLDWIPDDLAHDLRSNGTRSWPQVAALLGVHGVELR
jgi:glutathione S-transferase